MNALITIDQDTHSLIAHVTLQWFLSSLSPPLPLLFFFPLSLSLRNSVARLNVTIRFLAWEFMTANDDV